MPRELRVRLDDDVADRFDAFCLAARRSMTSAVNVLLTEALDAREAMGTDPKTDVGTSRPQDAR